MKYQNAKLRQMLAAEYVLGTLHGRARARFQRLLGNDPALLKEVYYWEQRLAAFAASIKPVTPRALVWTQIDHAINASKVTRLPEKPARSGVNFWRAWALAATAASVVLGFGMWQEMQRGPQIIEVPKIVAVKAPTLAMPYVALLQPEKSEAKWRVSLYPDRAMMKVAATGRYDMDDQHSLELWALEAQGPRSLGVLPTEGEAEMPLPKEMQVASDMTLAVSLEPRGGSPTGLPTGPVILSAPAIQAL